MSTVTFTRLRPAPRGPSAPQMAVNFARAAVRTGVLVAAGKPWRVSPEVTEARLAVCRTCEHHHHQGDAERCLHPGCGCFLRSLLLNKVELAAEECPAGKWPS